MPAPHRLMNKNSATIAWLALTPALASLGACGDDAPAPTGTTTTTAGSAQPAPDSMHADTPDSAVADAPYDPANDPVVTSTDITGTEAVPPGVCSLPADCAPLETAFISAPNCCRASTPCGYVISSTEDTVLEFPDAVEFLDTIWDDGCLSRDWVFRAEPGIDSYRVEGGDGEDILIDETCEYRNFWAFGMPGCCLPDNRCGISTDQIFTVFGVLLGGETAPFTQPQCVQAAELNQQLRDSGKLESLAYIPETTGTCDYAALDAALAE